MNFRLLMTALLILGSSAHSDPPVRPWALENPTNAQPQPVALPLTGQPVTGTAAPLQAPPSTQTRPAANAQTLEQQLMQSLSKSPGNNYGGGQSNAYNDAPDVYGEPCKAGDKPDAKGLAGMLSCIREKSYSVTNQMAFFVDSQKKQGFVVDKDTGALKYCVRISTGRNGVGSGYGQSARGLSTTTSHHGDYDSSGAKGPAADCIGLAGTGPETRERESKGCILHKAHGGEGRNSTLGCIGIEDSNWPEFKRIMYGSDHEPKHSAVFLYDSKSGPTCDGTRTAPIPISSPPTKTEIER